MCVGAVVCASEAMPVCAAEYGSEASTDSVHVMDSSVAPASAGAASESAGAHARDVRVAVEVHPRGARQPQNRPYEA